MKAATMELEGLPAAVDARRDLEPGRDGVLPNPGLTPMPVMTGIGPNPGEMIRAAAWGVTQEELARALGVTLSTLNRGTLHILRPPAATTISPVMKSDSGRQKR